MYIIDTDKKPPESRQGAGRRAKYPWRSMSVGDSFFVPLSGEVPSVRRLQSNLISSGSSALGSGNVSTRVLEEDGKPGVRVWRTG